ncbi:FMN-binding protein [candidate division KSB1 bacterium]|nr:FMN-binding protein [candidate division KSB1 bacterium]
MKDMLRLGAILFLVTGIASALLAFVNLKTKPYILAQKQREEVQARSQALPGADPTAIDKQKGGYFIGYKTAEKKEIAGYIFTAEGKGYAKNIKTMFGVDTAGVIQGLKITDQEETPGLGTKIQEVRYGETQPWFQQQFINKKGSQLFLKRENASGMIDGITGATISSQAVTSSVRKTIEKMRPVLGLKP